MEAYSLQSASLLRLGKLDGSMRIASEGLQLAQRLGARKNEAGLLSGLGLICIEQNRLAEAMAYLDQAIHVAREISDAIIEFSALNNLGNAAGLLGDYAMAQDCYERAYFNLRSRGDRYGESLMLGNLGWVSGMKGDFMASRSYLQQALSLAREVGSPYQEAYMLINLSAVFAFQNDTVVALECARRGYELCTEIKERSGEAWALLNMGHAHLLAREFEEAQAAYEQSISIRKELNQPNLAAEATAGLVQITLHTNDHPALSGHLESLLAAMSVDKELTGSEEPLRIYYVCHQALTALGDPRSHSVLQDALQLFETQISKFKDESARRMYVESVPWRRALQSLKVGKQ
jgi:tetratricopeptide (TPR) repeat protein